MAEKFRLIGKCLKLKFGPWTYFTAEDKVELVFMKMYSGLNSPKLY